MHAALVLSLASAGVANLSGAAARSTLTTEVSAPADAQWLARVSAATPLSIAIGLPLRNRVELEGLLRDLYDPGNPLFRRFLSVEQFTERFGPTAEDEAEVARFAVGYGLTVRRRSPNRMVLDVVGTVGNVERAFGIEMGLYRHPAEDRTFFAPNVEPSVESGVPILSVVGLTDRARPHPMSARVESQTDAPTTVSNDGTGPGGVFLGSDIRGAYAPGVSLDGKGQAVGLFELGPYNIVDIHNYFGSLGQSLAVPIVTVLLDGSDGGVPDGGDDGEVALDIEQAISLAPNLSSLIVYESDTSELDIWNQMATDNVAKQLSSSWAYGINDLSDDSIFLEFAAQGQNLFQASGDNGAYSLSMPMESPTDNANLVSVGGTHLFLASDGGWEAEVAWPNSGGGVSSHHVELPAYQTGVASSDNHGSTKFRNVPDVCAEADFDNYVCSNGGCAGGWGGTSFAAPRWAGFLALVNEQADGTPVGFLNPSVYALGKGATYGSVLHDITRGNDFTKASPDLYSATTGYDLVTGWGSPTGQSLIDALAPRPVGPNFTLVATPAFGEAPTRPDAGMVFTIALLPTNGFSAAVDLSAVVVGTAPGVAASLSASTLTGSTSVDLTVSSVSAPPVATFQVVVVGKSGTLLHEAYVTLGPQSFFLRVPSQVFLDQAANASLTLAVNPLNGFQDQVELSFEGPADGGLPRGISTVLSTSQAVPSYPPLELALTATADATTGLIPLTLIGDAGGITNVAQTVLAVSAATGTGGVGLPVDLSLAFNDLHIATDGVPFYENRTVRNDFYAYSANLLGPTRVLSGVQFVFGAPDQLDAVSANGQSLVLPQGSFTDLWLLAAGINGAQASQHLILNYTDRSGDVLTQSFSDWDFPGSSDGGEIEAVAMAYRALGNGSIDASHIQNLYAYRFPVDQSKTVASLTLPQNPNLIVHAITLLGPGALDAGVDTTGDGGKVASRPTRGCGCWGGGGDASHLALALLVAARRRRKS